MTKLSIYPPKTIFSDMKIRHRVETDSESMQPGRNSCLAKNNSPFSKQALVFMCLHLKSFENTVGKEEIAHHKLFLLLPQRFLHL